MTIEQRIAAAESSLERQLEWNTRFDNRSAVVLGVETAMLGVLASFAPDAAAWTWPMIVAAIFAVGTIATSLILLALAQFPDTVAPAKTLLFWGIIGCMNCEDFKEQSIARTDEEHLADLLEQIHRVSEILCSKFKRLKASYKWTIFALAPWCVTLAFFKLAAARACSGG